jgi:small subunit ribosomal protein SAe
LLPLHAKSIKMSKNTGILALQEADLKLMLAAHVHFGTKNLDPNMERYIWRRRQDGVYLINLGKTWEKLMLAARIIVAIENPEDVIVVSARPYGQRAVFKFAQHTGAAYIGGRYTPGTFTNQIQRRYVEPRLLVVTDPRVDHQPVREASYGNIPCIAFCNSDAPLEHVDVAIPANNRAKHSIALMYWLLAREVLRMRGIISRAEHWNVMVDLFMHREPEEVEKGDERPADAAPEQAEAERETGLQETDAADGPATFETPAGAVADWGGAEGGADQNWQAPAAPTGWDGGR